MVSFVHRISWVVLVLWLLLLVGKGLLVLLASLRFFNLLSRFLLFVGWFF